LETKAPSIRRENQDQPRIPGDPRAEPSEVGFDQDGEYNPRTADRPQQRSSADIFFRRRFFRMGAVGLTLIVAILAVPVWNYLSSYEDTDDAQVDGHIAPISSRINGTTEHVYVINTEAVDKGQILADIDPRDYQVAVENSRANLLQAKAQVESARAEYENALSKINEDEASRVKAEYDVPRLQILAAEGAARREDYQESLRLAKVAVAAVAADRAAADVALKDIASRQAAVQAAQAVLDQALLNLSYTKITAPMSGVIGKKTVEPGQRVEPGEELMAVVPEDDVWVTANFKETQIRKMRTGQSVEIYVDALGRTYHGYVFGLGAASGEIYSLIPPENATGNYVKVVQRIPVRIAFDPGQNDDHRLALGMSVEPTVWLK
jgi:membrane fusion protein, multidrug efflux system